MDASPMGGGRTHTVLSAVLAGAATQGAQTRVLTLADRAGSDELAGILAELEDDEALVLGSPVYRASFAAPLKALLDVVPRGMWGETKEPLRGRAMGMVLTGASWHHYLALNDLRNVLAGFFAAHVLAPGVYAPAEAFTPDKRLVDSYDELARSQGAALVCLAEAVSGSPSLRHVRPQA